MWRPEGWENPYGMYTSDGRYDDFENGADAMLTGLLNQNTMLYLPANSWILNNPIKLSVGGTLVFIPDES